MSTRTRVTKPRAEKKWTRKTTPGAGGSSKAKKTKAGITVEDVERDENGVAYFYFRSDPTVKKDKGTGIKFSIQDLANKPGGTTAWEGVRNNSAGDWIRQMRIGDRGFFYHSNAGLKGTGIVGTVKIVKEPYADSTAWNENSPYFREDSTEEDPKWFSVDIKLDEQFENCIPRTTLLDSSVSEAYMIKRGRVPVGPVRPAEWNAIMEMAEEE